MDFCKITAIIHPLAINRVKLKLRELRVPGVSISHVMGFHQYPNNFVRDGMDPHVRIEIFIGRHRAEEIAETIMHTAHSGVVGDGIVAIQPVESIYHIRTLKKCEKDACE